MTQSDARLVIARRPRRLAPARRLLAVAALACQRMAAHAQKNDEGFQTSAPHAILIEAESGSVLLREERRPARSARRASPS